MLKVLTLGVWLYSAAIAEVKPVGAVTAVDAGSRTLTIQTDSGAALAVKVAGAARLVRVAAGETSLAKAAPVALSDIAVGDRVLARGAMSADETSIDATTVVVMPKTEIAKKHEAERAEWARRGIAGTVKSVDAAAKKVIVVERAAFSPGAAAAPKEIAVDVAKASLRRYAPGSVKFSDAAASDLARVLPGDQVRALGEKTDGGASFTAEKFVSGTFKNLAVTVKSIDATAGTMVATDLDTKKTVAIAASAETTLRKMPEMMARMMAMRASGGGPPAGLQARPGGGPPQGAMRGGGDFLERMPAFALADLKPGDALIIATASGDAGKLTAITIVAGVEPILQSAPQSQRQQMVGSWNLDMNPGMTP